MSKINALALSTARVLHFALILLFKALSATAIKWHSRNISHDVALVLVEHLLCSFSERSWSKQVCSASSLGCQHDTTHICCWAPCCGAVAAERAYIWYAARRRQHRQLSIDISFQLGVQQQTPGRHCCCRAMVQTDGRRLDRYIDPAPHTMRAVSVRGKN